MGTKIEKFMHITLSTVGEGWTADMINSESILCFAFSLSLLQPRRLLCDLDGHIAEVPSFSAATERTSRPDSQCGNTGTHDVQEAVCLPRQEIALSASTAKTE